MSIYIHLFFIIFIHKMTNYFIFFKFSLFKVSFCIIFDIFLNKKISAQLLNDFLLHIYLLSLSSLFELRNSIPIEMVLILLSKNFLIVI